MAYLFALLAAVAFVGVFIHARSGNATMMAYSGVVWALWIAAALWWAGVIG